MARALGGNFSHLHEKFLEVILGIPGARPIISLCYRAYFCPPSESTSTTPAVSSNGLEPWVLVAQGTESRHRQRGSAPSTRYIGILGSSSLFILHEQGLVALHPAEPDLRSSALPAFCLQVARQLDCSFFTSRPPILFSVHGSQRECVADIVRVHLVVVGNTHASRVALETLPSEQLRRSLTRKPRSGAS